MYDDLKGKVVIVTGASSGIGYAIAERFRREGARVYNLDIKPPNVSIEGVEYLRCDVSDEKMVRDAIETIASREGRIDVVVNNAGIESYGSVHEVSPAEWDRIMNVNLRGSYLVSHYAIPYMMERGGVIEFISSVQAVMVQRRVAAYVASKHALIGLMKSIAVDYAPKIRSVAILPGSVRTPLLEWAAAQEVGNDPVKIRQKIEEWGRLYPMKRVAEPYEIAALAVFLASNEASYITGAAIIIDGGISIYLPESVPEK